MLTKPPPRALIDSPPRVDLHCQKRNDLRQYLYGFFLQTYNNKHLYRMFNVYVCNAVNPYFY